MEAFEYKGTALNEGLLKSQFDEVCALYKDLSNDSLLKPYRIRAGKPAPGIEMGGHYVDHNPFGQYLSGFARVYAATQDLVYRNKVEAMLKGWGECIESDGFFFAERDPGLPHYYYDKMVSGLVDTYIYCGFDEALVHLRHITNWAISHLSQAKPYAMPIGKDGAEWYTLSENLYRAYLTTNDPVYKNFAEVWEYREFWNHINQEEDIFKYPMNGGWYHAYSHVNSFCGLGAAYLVKQDGYYIDTLKKAYEFLLKEQMWPTGGYGPNECLFPKQQLASLLESTDAHFETQCGSWAGFKMAKYLILLTDDACYGDWIEKLLYNGIGASIPVEKDGKVFYYSNYHLGGASKKPIHPWTCCTGSRIQAVADYHDLLYFHDEGNLFVNIFAPSTVCWEKGNTEIKVTQKTVFPESNTTKLVVNVKSPVEFAVNIRVPGWLSSPMKVRVNGKITDARANEKHWAVLKRCWGDGDEITIEFPMDFSMCSVDDDMEFPAAIMYGPVVMAVSSPEKNPSGLFDFKNPANNLVPVQGEKLVYRLASDDTVTVRPFYQYEKEQNYFMFLNPECRYFRASFSKMKLSPEWKDIGRYTSSNKVGATIEYSFEGSGIKAIGYTNNDCGKFEVWVDDTFVGVVDQYGASMGEAVSWEFKGFSSGVHNAKLVIVDDKASESKGNCVNIVGIEVYQGN